MAEEKAKTAEKAKTIKLTDRVECIVTKEGEAYKHNKWKEGQVIKCHPETAAYFVKHKLVKLK